MDQHQINWKKCKRCGSYIPVDWKRCGNCGKETGKRGVYKVVIAIILVAGFCLSRYELLSFLHPYGLSDITPPIQLNTQGYDVQYQNKISQLVTEGAEELEFNTINPFSMDSTDPENTYTLIYDALVSVSESVNIPPVHKSEQIFDMVEKIVLCEPEIMFYSGCTYRSDGLLKFKYSKEKEYILSARDEVRKKADEILLSIVEPGMTDFDKELAIHNYIVNNCRYDLENFEKNQVPPESHNIYGVLVEGKAVCEGYAKTMKYLLNKVGIDALVITGKSKGQLHAWNLVKIDGFWYHLDPTWNDPISQDGSHTLKHTYFNLSDQEIMADHTWNTEDYPACESTLYNYYVYNNKIVTSANELLNFYMASIENGDRYVTVRISDYSSDKYDLVPIIIEVATVSGKRVSYSINESYGVVDLWLEASASY